MHVRVAFAKLLGSIERRPPELASAKLHASQIKVRLNSHLGKCDLLTIGSASRGTSIREHSDLDLLAVFTRDVVRHGNEYVTSHTLLDNVRRCLAGRFQKTAMGRDRHAIVVDFGDMSVDVVPSFYWGAGKEKGWPLYGMPDGGGWWMKTSPLYHNSFLRQANKQSGGKLFATAKLMKYWRLTRAVEVRISSFYIEMALAISGICNGAKSYPQCLADLFVLLNSRHCGSLDDPLGIAGCIPCGTEAQRQASMSSVREARSHAEMAIVAEASGNMPEARRRWSMVFNEAVPDFRR